MKSFAAIVGLAAVAQAQYYNGSVVYTTKTVETLTTYCPEATTLTYGTKTYTATAHETLTITDCPCTVTEPIHTPYPTKPADENVYVTTTVSEYTTYCPYPTVIPIGVNSTITVTEATTLTLTNCPCTLTKPGYVTVTTDYVTTYCPSATTLTVPVPSGTPITYPVTAPGTVTIPIEQPTTVVATEPVVAPTYTPVPPPATTPVQIPGTGNPVQPTTTGPIEANDAIKRSAGFGAMFVAGLAAML